MPKWTEEQRDAIDHEGVNIIVSAGAGSGKTAVLTERVIRKLKSGININELLVLTFTNAAAFEMKERIRASIKKEESLKKQLSLIDGAYITTFDSFALSMVKKYHYLLNINNNVKISDDSLIYIEKSKIVDEVFEDMYVEKNEKFLKFINDFCIKNDKEIRKYILNVSSKLDLKYDKKEYLNYYIDTYFSDEIIGSHIHEFNEYLFSQIKDINNQITDLSNYVDSNYINNLVDVLQGLLNSTSYIDIKNNLNIKLPLIPKNSDEEAKKIKDNISSIIKNLKNICIYDSDEEIKQSIISTKDYIFPIIKIINKIDKKIDEFKLVNNVYEFNDISKMAIKILKENQIVCDELKESFNEIMVDEYQDTSDLQESFISLIENNNVYMVGDIKQSIYRFRNANPYIFKEKYDKYSKNINGYKIDLNKNFRSRKETLENINIIFNIIMDDIIGGANYKETHQMIFGNNSYIENGSTDQNNNFEIYNYEYTKDSKYNKEEIEAFIVASDIMKKINNKYQIFDKNKGILRYCTYNDFVILMDRSTKFDLYKKIFEYMNLPLTKYTDTSITNSNDSMIIKNIIGLIINTYNSDFNVQFKYNFLSIGRSYLFNYTDEELFDYIENNKTKDSDIMKIIYEILKDIQSLSINNILDLIIDKFHFYENLVKVGDVQNSLIRIEYIYNLSKTASEVGYDIESFYNYLSKLIEDDFNIKVSMSENIDNSVKIMTIHKSKGLEYSICYYCGIYASFNIADVKDRITFDNKYGIITPYYKEGIADTIYKILFKNNYVKEEISEKIRLFYVALTRCKEKMIIVAPFGSDLEIHDEIMLNDKLKYKSFLDILNSIGGNLKDYITDIKLEDTSLTKDYNSIKISNYTENIRYSNELIDKVSLNIVTLTKDNKKFSKSTNGLINSKVRENMKFGKYLHYLFECIDFKNPNFNIIDSKYSNYIHSFLNCGLDFSSCNIYKEYEFMYNDKDNIYNGVIDLILEYDNEVKIIDYKLNSIDDENYINQLLGYKNYIMNKTNKSVKVYLYSIIEKELKELGK